MNTLVFELQEASFSYPGGIPAVREISMAVEKGTIVCVLGANGTGKSSLLHMLDALVFAQSGQVRAFGTVLSERSLDDPVFLRVFRKKVGFVFQNPEIQLFNPTVREDILFGPLNLGLPHKQAEARMNELCAFLGISGLLDRPPHQLSIGEKKKVAIATTLVSEPEVLLLDEPTAGLDPLTSRQITRFILETSAAGRTVIAATHDLHFVEEAAGVIHVLDREKRLAKSGQARDLLSDEGFLREHNLIHAHSHSHDTIVHAHPHTHVSRPNDG